MNNKNINDITLFRYLFSLDNRDLPRSILMWYKNIGSIVDSYRENAISELYSLRGNCRNLVLLSKSFVDAMDKSYIKFTQFHMDILEELDGENGIVRSPYFIEGCYVVYSVKNGCLTLWVFHNNDYIDKYLSIPTFYVCVSPKDKIKGEGHQLDGMIIPLIDNLYEENIRDYIDMVLDYLCLRQWAEVQLKCVSTTTKKQVKKAKKSQVHTVPGLDFYTFDINPHKTNYPKKVNYFRVFLRFFHLFPLNMNQNLPFLYLLIIFQLCSTPCWRELVARAQPLESCTYP